jgi:hypothetical protein
MRIAPPVELSPEQRRALEGMARQRSLPLCIVERARIALLAADGLENKPIAQRLHSTPEKAARWRKRFFAVGITALEKDAPWPVKPRATHWSTRIGNLHDALHQAK